MNDQLLRDAVAYSGRWLAFQQRLQEIPAITVAIRHGEDLILSQGYGHANLEDCIPVTPEHIFRVASHSKWFTATAIMQLKEQGKLRLDDPLGQYVHWLHGPLADITLRQVLNHAGGITRDGYDNDHWQLEHPFPDAGQLRALVEQGGEVMPSNQALKYSNIGYSLLGEVVASASGMSYHDYVRRHIIERLGLENTGPETDAHSRSRLVTGYTSRALLMPHFPLPDVTTGAMAAATGFYSTAEDLTRFASAHFFGNDELIGDTSKREMQRAYWQVEGMDSYGLGMQVATIGERTVVGHSGGFPGHTTRTYLDPTDQVAISILTSETGGVATDLTKSVIKLIDLALKQEIAGSQGLDRYVGRFVALWGYLDIFRLGDQLFMGSPESDDPATIATKLTVTDEVTLSIEEKGGYGSPGESVRFFRTEDGRLDHITVAGSTHVPIDDNPEYLTRRRDELIADRVTAAD